MFFFLGTYLCPFLTTNLTNFNPPENFHKLTEDIIFIVREKTLESIQNLKFGLGIHSSHQSKTLAGDQKWTLICFHVSFKIINGANKNCHLRTQSKVVRAARVDFRQARTP